MYKFLLIIFVCILSLKNGSIYASVKIKYKVGDEIITNTDIIKEKNYLIFLRPELKNLTNDEIQKISENSLIRELIKKKEVKRVFNDLDNEKIIEGIKIKLFSFKKVKSESEFLKLLSGANIDYEKVVEKMKYEAFWNELIFQKYNSLVKIDKDELKLNLKKKISENKKYEYNLSEILFEIEKNENLQNKYKKIINYIKSNDFKTAASRFSISNSANNSGEIGWIKETLLSSNLNTLLSKLNINETTKPIKYPSGYLILKINNKREIKQKINMEKELNEMIRYEQNKQLNQFSLLFYKKLKQNIKINEY